MAEDQKDDQPIFVEGPMFRDVCFEVMAVGVCLGSMSYSFGQVMVTINMRMTCRECRRLTLSSINSGLAICPSWYLHGSSNAKYRNCCEGRKLYQK